VGRILPFPIVKRPHHQGWKYHIFENIKVSKISKRSWYFLYLRYFRYFPENENFYNGCNPL